MVAEELEKENDIWRRCFDIKGTQLLPLFYNGLAFYGQRRVQAFDGAKCEGLERANYYAGDSQTALRDWPHEETPGTVKGLCWDKDRASRGWTLEAQALPDRLRGPGNRPPKGLRGARDASISMQAFPDDAMNRTSPPAVHIRHRQSPDGTLALNSAPSPTLFDSCHRPARQKPRFTDTREKRQSQSAEAKAVRPTTAQA
ncbi:hypothetical protein CC78DRAFT_584637 [Lojkania enalia]|uniref:Uncharacterized protein n=1 Tax=Lojkania enalia TaxID=147567 RepID=A0A9P4N6I1_9PLEO|nr:hypothetical protein CC78DRAFT_584637 [Didymosphaeria enalia]